MKKTPTPSIDHAITARLNLAAIKVSKRTRSQLEAHLCQTLKIAEALKALTNDQIYNICKPPAKEDAS